MFLHFIKWLKGEIIRQYYRTFVFPNVYFKSKRYHEASILDTIHSLINSNKSLSRFGDGELGWILQRHVFTSNTSSFEKNSNLLSKRLVQVLSSNNPDLEIGLPYINKIHDIYYKDYIKRAVKNYMSKLGTSWMKYLNPNKQYYNSDITRSFSVYKYRFHSKLIFNELKKIWNNKDLLIIEGRGTRIGIKDGLINNANSIHRIECPITNAFESYDKILNWVQSYLYKHPKYLSLISLGPTATVLVYDLCNKGYRAIDVGHLDVEYEWYLRGKECNIPYKYVNEMENGEKIYPINDNKYKKEIVKNIY